MKTILILAAVLMAGASVYGLVDYHKKSGTKEFRQLYTGENPATTTEKKTVSQKTEAVSPSSDTRKEIPATTEVKPAIKKKMVRKFRFSEFSRAPLQPVEKKDTALMQKDIH